MSASEKNLWYLLPARFMLAFIWIMGGALNMMDMSTPTGPERYGILFGEVWTEGLQIDLPVPSTLYVPDSIPENPIPFVRDVLRDVVAPNIQTFLLMAPITELLIGITLLLGFMTRLSALGAVLMNLTILLASGHTHPGILRVNLLMLAVAVTLFLSKSGRHFGIDKFLSKKYPNIPLW